MSQMSPTLPATTLTHKKSTMDRVTMKDFFVSDVATEQTTFDPVAFDSGTRSSGVLGACGLPAQPLEPAVIREWESALEAEVSTLPIGIPRVGGAGLAELSGFEDDEEVGGGDALPEDSDEDEFDDFDDIDEDDFDDDFDDDFEEELDDDYEIEIEDEISAEFGLSGVDAGIDAIEDIDAIDVIDVIDDDIVVDLDVDDNAGEK